MMQDTSSIVDTRLSWRRIQELLRNPPAMALTAAQFAAIQDRIWARLSQKLDPEVVAGR